jgi:predicted RNA-binding protein with PUA-like domain
MAYWLIKSEPETFSLEDFRNEKVTVWHGVRNYTARNNLRTMQLDDIAIFYRSVKKPAVEGLARVVKEHYQDPTTEETAWLAVDFELIEEFRNEVPLSKIKEIPELLNMELLKLSRLSVQRVSDDEFETICKLGRG